jgi:dimethylaniline monooxygenase (N-oxide forming)
MPSQTNTFEKSNQDSFSHKTVCIIGAGVAGLVSAKVLKRDGFEVTVFEKESAIGGVWAEPRSYPELRSNNPRETYAFSDFDYPESADEFPTAGQIRDYLESYTGYFELEPHIHLETEVLSVSRREPASDRTHPGFRVKVRPVHESEGIESYNFDFVVICNGVFSEPYVPEIKSRDQYDGIVLHSSQFTNKEIVSGKNVVVVGAGKSALDCATFASNNADTTTLVFRKPHWMIPRYFGETRVDDVLFNRFSEKIFPAYHKATKTEKAFRFLASPLIWLWTKIVSKIVMRQSEMPEQMIPDVPLISGIENNGIGTEFYQVLNNNGRTTIKRARITSFSDRDKLKLDTGEEIETDVVIFATGWSQDVSFIDADLRRTIRRDGWFQLYRHILPPKEQRLGFVGYASSGNNPLTSEISAHWLSQHFRGELLLPNGSEMEQEIERVRSWTQKVFPRRNEGYFIGAYVGSYIDELMLDMGLKTKRTEKFFDEYWGAFWSKRYKDVKEERLQLRER